MFKKLFQTLGISSSNPAPGDGPLPAAEKNAEQKETKGDAFLTILQVYEDQCKSAMEVAELGQEHAAKVNRTGKVNPTLVAQLNSVLAGIKKTEVDVSKHLEGMGSDIPTATHDALAAMADRIAAVHNAVDKAIKDIRFAKLDFNSERDDDDDDGE